ncbi:MAG: Hsp20/alpha crystallin family protein [Desulfobacteraceae bacterium]|nr:Hsp20/alpha crystallin family protein [Desulfobacteraceae bacterium]
MMNLVKWNPWREMPTLPGRFNRFFNDPFFHIGPMADENDLGMWNPAVDLYEKDDHYVIKAELPGIDKNNVKIDLKDRLLTLSGERTYDNEVKEENCYRRERSYGKFQRVFTLPADVDSDKIKAEFKNGVLQIEVPKPEEKKAKRVTIH